MATLTNRTPSVTYKNLLQVDNSNLGIDATLRVVEDGAGNDLPLKVSTADIALNATSKIYLDGGNNTYISEAVADTISLYVGGNLKGKITADGVTSGNTTLFPMMGATTPTATNPSFYPIWSDIDTGIGWAEADQLSLIAGGKEMLRLKETGTATTDQMIIAPAGVIGTAATPALAFGDGDTGFYESSDDDLRVTLGGTAQWIFITNQILSNGGDGAGIVSGGVSSIVPSFEPRRTDGNTGIGWANADQMSLIAGGKEVQRLIEGDGEVSTVLSGTVVETITDATSAGNNTLTKIGENFNVTCSVGDAVLVYGGTTAADYGTYIITGTAATVLTLDRALAGSDADVDFDVIADGVVVENSTTTGVATLRTPKLIVAPFTQYYTVYASAASLGPTAPAATTIETFRGLLFNANAEEAFIEFEIPDDWNGTSDMTLKIYGFPTAGDAIADTEVVEFDAVYRSVAKGEAYDNGTAVTISPNYTQSGAGTDKALIELTAVIDYDNANQPLAKDDVVGFKINRDVTTSDTYSGNFNVIKFEIAYTANTFTLHN